MITISSGNGDDVLIGNEGADILQAKQETILFKVEQEDDNLQGGSGDDTYIFSRRDGKDTIYDTSGNDTLKFKEGITQADLIVKADVNSNDLIVALKDGDKAFAELTDKIVLKDWFKTNNRVENFTFEDGTILLTNDIVALQAVTSGDDYVRYTEANDIIEGKEGNDTLVGGDGDDTYRFGRGDGEDTIIDIAKDNDIISFKENISISDIVVQVIGTQNDCRFKRRG